MHNRKIVEWKLLAPENGGKLQDCKMAENAPLENGGMENDRPRKWWKITGPGNGVTCTTGKWRNGKLSSLKITEWKKTYLDKA